MSKFDVVGIGKLQLLSDILSPSWVDFDLVCHQRASEESVPEVWCGNWSSLVVALHSSLAAFDVLSVKQQLMVDIVNWWRVSLHLPNGETPEQNETGNHSFRHGREVSDSSPVSVAGGILDEFKKVFDASSLVGSVDTLFAESVFFEFPIVLFSDGSKWMSNDTCRSFRVFRHDLGRGRTWSSCRGFCVRAKLPDFEALFYRGVSDPNVVGVHLLVDGHS